MSDREDRHVTQSEVEGENEGKAKLHGNHNLILWYHS